MTLLNTYEWILFDADETLFHFDAFSGLQLMFSRLNISFTEHDYHEYEIINKALWKDFQTGQISAQELQHNRFNSWAQKLEIVAHDLNRAFLNTMAEISIPLQGAIDLLNTLKGKVKLGIITNGFTELQHTRLKQTGLNDHFDLLVISEEVGITKPHKGIFEHALAIMGNPIEKHVLMVGDTLETDILGGINAGLDTCWLNVNNKPSVANITPQYQVSSLSELKELLFNLKQSILF